MARTRYYEVAPRGFANEINLYAVPEDMAQRFEALQPNARQVTRAEALGLSHRDGCKFVGDEDYAPGESFGESVGWARAGATQMIREWERQAAALKQAEEATR